MQTTILCSPLVDAAKRGSSEDVKILSEEYGKRKTKRRDFYPALYIGAFQGHEDVVRILLSKGADPNYCLEGCLPTLHAAAQKGRLSIAKLLLDHGAKVNPELRTQSRRISVVSEETEYFSSPILTAARGGHTKMVKLLLEKGANINARLNSTSVKVFNDIDRILAFGDYSDSNICSKSLILGYTSLHFAVEAGEKYVVNLLLQYGADVNSKSERGVTPLSLAVEKGEKSIIQILRKAGADEKIPIEGIPLFQLMTFREIFGANLKRKKSSSRDMSNDSKDEENRQESSEIEPTPIKKTRLNFSPCTIS